MRTKTKVAKRPKLELSGQDGNAFFILGRASRVMRDSGWDETRQSAFMEEAQSGDYYHLLQTCSKYFDVT